MRDMDHLIAAGDGFILESPDPGLQAVLVMESLGAGVEIDALGLPAAVTEFADRFSEAASDIEEAPGRAAMKRREEHLELRPGGQVHRHVAFTRLLGKSSMQCSNRQIRSVSAGIWRRGASPSE